MKQKVLFLMMLLCLVVGKANAQTFITETPTFGSSYYIYTVNQRKFLNDNNGLDATPNVLWKIGGTFNSNYTLTSANSKQFAMYRSGSVGNRVYNVVTNATGQSGNNVNLTSALSNGKYSIYRQSKNGSNWSGDRNVVSTQTGITRQSDASYEWCFVSQDQIDAVYPAKLLQSALSNNNITTTWSKAESVDNFATYQTTNSNEWCVEAFKWAGTSTGEYLTLTVSGLNNGYYELKMGACASSTSSRDNGGATLIAENEAETYASLHANNASVAMTAYNQLGCESLDEYTLTGINVTNGTMKIYINIDKANVNWVLASIKSLAYLGDKEVSLKVNSTAKYGTFIAPFEVTLPEGVTAYSINAYSNKETGELAATNLGNTITANTPVLLYSENGADKKYYGVAGDEQARRSGWLVGYNTLHSGSLAESGYKNYILQNGTNGVKFYYADDTKYTAGCNANRAYLSIPTSEAAAKVLSVSFDETTAIDLVSKEDGATEYYTINGVKVDAPVKGMNIVKMSNGSVKKIFVK